MATIDDVLETQKVLEESIVRRLDKFQAQLGGSSSTSSPATDLKELAGEFYQFRDLVGGMLKLLRQQIAVLMRNVDSVETGLRRKAVLFNGVEENKDGDPCKSVLAVLHSSLGLTNISKQDITTCHRLGANSKGRPRPVLVRFASLSTKVEVWSNKTKLKGTPVALAEFLTRHRQTLFVAARRHFGFRRVWSNDGNIFVKLPDGKLARVYDTPELDKLFNQYPAEQTIHMAATSKTTSKPVPSTAEHKSASNSVRPKRAVRK